jgi:hypothetical protein
MPPLILIKSTGLVSSICFDGSREINDSAVGTRFREVRWVGCEPPNTSTSLREICNHSQSYCVL